MPTPILLETTAGAQAKADSAFQAAVVEAVAAAAEAEARARAAADTDATPKINAARAQAINAADLAARGKYVAKPAGPVKRFDIRDYLTEGQALPNDGVLDASPLLRLVYEAAWAWHLTTIAFRVGGIPAEVYAPPGLYRMLQSLLLKSAIGVCADGHATTHFRPEGTACFLNGPLWFAEPAEGWTYFDDVTFQGFTVDCGNQNNPAGYDGTVKAFYTNNMRRMRVQDVHILDCYASAFGMDFLIESTFYDCYVYGAGRSNVSENSLGPTCSGFAPGTGRFAEESVIWTNCVAEGCKGAGWLLEQVPQRAAFLRTPGYTLVNCKSVRNKFGLSNAGCGGVTAIGCDFSFNTHSGIVVSGSGARAAGRNGLISSCTFFANGGGTVGADGRGGHGISFVYGANPDGWSLVGNLFLDNLGYAVHVDSNCAPVNGGLRMTGGIVRGNQGGVKVLYLNRRLRGMLVEGVLFEDNTEAALWFEDGLTAPQIIDNTFTRNPIAIRWCPERKTTTPVVRGNVLTDNIEAMLNTPLDDDLIEGNLVTQTVNVALEALAGAQPVFVSDESGSTQRFTSDLAWDGAQPSTTYLVRETAPTSNTLAQLRGAADQSRINIGRATGNANWLAGARAADGTTVVNVTVPGPVAPAVLAAVRTENALTLHVHGVGTNTAAVAGWSASPTVTSAVRPAGFSHLVTFPGAHDEAKRTAIMARLTAEYLGV